MQKQSNGGVPEPAAPLDQRTGEAANAKPVRIRMSEHERLIGKYMLAYHQNRIYCVKFIGCDAAAKRAFCEVALGDEVGQKIDIKYDPNQMVDVVSELSRMKVVFEEVVAPFAHKPPASPPSPSRPRGTACAAGRACRQLRP